MRKLTKRDYFNAIITVMEKVGMDVPVAIDEENSVIISSTEIIDFANREKDLLSRKSGAERKPTKTQVENEKLKIVLLGILGENDRPMTATEISKAFEMDISLNKTVALLRQLVEKGEVIRTVEKKTPFFTLAEEVEDIDEN